MQSRRLISIPFLLVLTLVLTGVLGLMAGWLRPGLRPQLANAQESAHGVASHVSANPIAADFLQYALELRDAAVENGDRAKADALYRLAMRRLVDFPQSAGLMWETIQSLAPDGESTSDPAMIADYLAYLVSFQDGLEQAVFACACPDRFNEMWGIKEGVLQTIAEWRLVLARVIATDVNELNKRCLSPKDVDLAGLTSDLPVIAAWVMALLASGPEDQEEDKAIGIVATEVAVTCQGLAQLAGNLADQAATNRHSVLHAPVLEPFLIKHAAHSDRSNTEDVVASGPNQILLERIAAASTLLQLEAVSLLLLQAAIHSSFGEDESPVLNPSMVADSLDKAGLECRETQLLAYYLWALSQIELASDAPDWEESLSRIDQVFLDPAVSAIYGSTYSELISAEKEPYERSRKARIFVTATRVSARAF